MKLPGDDQRAVQLPTTTANRESSVSEDHYISYDQDVITRPAATTLF